eukprot:TRINITY_DN11538_c0_g2_i1.p1 TRINITY_DN11538_c0_g2~~TRINITY_DN11538_c0_g2_i1.p1  ORF type:complete len:271 (-),score=52.55 TRINITY_DN11538_c0_g2_i1:40-735(-)
MQYGGGEDNGDDLMRYLDQKRAEVAAMTQAAETAREQALALLRLQRQASAASQDYVDQEVRYDDQDSNAGRPWEARPQASPIPLEAFSSSTSLSREDRLRFGLDDTPPPTIASEGGFFSGGDLTQFRQVAEHDNDHEEERPEWSSLSSADRKRFGLLSSDHVEVGSLRKVTIEPAVSHPDVLWGSAGSPGLLSMAKTCDQLKAVGATQRLADLAESERQLARLKMAGSGGY